MRHRGERGQAGGFEAIAFGLLACVAGGLLVVNLWSVVDAKFAVDAAASEAARTLVERVDGTESTAEAEAMAAAIAERALRDHGRPERPRVSVATGDFRRCQRVEVRVSISVPAVRLPFVGGIGRPIAVAARHSELVDPARSGVEGEAWCIG